MMHAAGSSQRHVKYLIVDDHAPSRQLIRDFLPGSDPEVIECADGAQALIAFFENERPDWVLMDVEMPGLDGLSALRAMRFGYPDARVVIVSQHDGAVLRAEAIADGAMEFIPKDDLTQLRRLLESYLTNP